MSNEVFKVKLVEVLDYFAPTGETKFTDNVSIQHEKGINIHVLATVAAMLIVWSADGKSKLNINTLWKTSTDLDELMKLLNYSKFDPYITYIMSYGKKAEKLKKKETTRAEYIALFVRYIYLLKEIGSLSD